MPTDAERTPPESDREPHELSRDVSKEKLSSPPWPLDVTPSGEGAIGSEDKVFWGVTDSEAPSRGRPEKPDREDSETPPERQAPLHLAVAASCLLALILALFLRAFVAQAYEIRGKSMEPTLHDGEKVMISKLTPGLQTVDRGDLIIFTSPLDSRKDLIKRVIAVAGDEIEIHNRRVIINGDPLEERYITRDLRPLTVGRIPSPVPPGKVVVLGDNRPNSQDSRHFGAIPIENVKGEVFLRWWPISDATVFP